MLSEGLLLEVDLPWDYSGNESAIAPLARMSPAQKKEFWATLALRHCAGLGARRLCQLLKHFKSACAAFENADSWGSLGIPDKVKSEIRRENWRKAAAEEWKNAARENAGILLWQNPAYPARLRELPDAPSLLYGVGDFSLLNSPAIAVVGSRNASERGREIAFAFAAAISACGIAVVSGMAEGIDKAAHIAALANIGKSIGALGTGIDKIYPWSNRELFSRMAKSGLLLSEFSPGSPPKGANFPIRNRIISGLSLGVLVVEAAEHSGSLITARLALEQNREVFAIPCGPMDTRFLGCQNLIRNGATPVFILDDIINSLKDQLKTSQLPDIEVLKNAQEINKPVQRKVSARKETPAPAAVKAATALISGDKTAIVLECLRKNGAMLVDSLADMAGVPAGELNSLLIGLELNGDIRRLPGQRYEVAD